MLNVEQKSANVKQKSANVKQKSANIEQKSANVEQKSANVEQKSANVKQKSADIEQKIAAFCYNYCDSGIKNKCVGNKIAATNPATAVELEWSAKMNENAMNSFVWGYQDKTWGLRIENGEISLKTWFSKKTIALSEVDKVVWDGMFGRVIINGQKQTIDFYSLNIGDVALRNEMIVFLRNVIPHEKQTRWKNLCNFIDVCPKRWMPKEKSTEPIKREPDPTKGEFLYTRKHCMKWIPWLIVMTILVLIGAPCFHFFLCKKFPLETIPLHNPYNTALFSTVFCFVPWLAWLASYFLIPKEGKLTVNLLKSKTGRMMLAICGFGYLFLLIFPLVIHSVERLLEPLPKVKEIFGILLLSAFVITGLFITIKYGIADYRESKKRMAEMPDDYIPEILTRYMIDQSFASQGDAANTTPKQHAINGGHAVTAKMK